MVPAGTLYAPRRSGWRRLRLTAGAIGVSRIDSLIAASRKGTPSARAAAAAWDSSRARFSAAGCASQARVLAVVSCPPTSSVTSSSATSSMGMSSPSS